MRKSFFGVRPRQSGLCDYIIGDKVFCSLEEVQTGETVVSMGRTTRGQHI